MVVREAEIDRTKTAPLSSQVSAVRILTGTFHWLSFLFLFLFLSVYLSFFALMFLHRPVCSCRLIFNSTSFSRNCFSPPIPLYTCPVTPHHTHLVKNLSYPIPTALPRSSPSSQHHLPPSPSPSPNHLTIISFSLHSSYPLPPTLPSSPLLYYKVRGRR